MRKRFKKIPFKNIAIVVLALAVLGEGYYIYKLKSQKKIIPPPVKKEFVARKIPKPHLKGKIAIVIDDCGYNRKHCDFLETVKSPLAISILPKLPHSRDVAECAHQNNKEVMLHLPMEPYESFETYPDHYILKTSMKRNEIENLIDEFLASTPHAIGVNNHTGSKATEDIRFMTIVFNALKKHGLFFVDSLVTDRSICRKLAQRMQFPFGQRDIFLDNTNTRDYIESQFRKLAERADQAGWAIGICHDRALSLQVLGEQIPRLESEGYRFIPVSQIIHAGPDGD